jgi:hypothetical protein
MTEMNFDLLTATEGEDYVFRMLSNPFTRQQRLMALGIPGAGKSFLFKAVAKRMGARFIDLRLLQLDLGSFRGLERILEVDGEVVTSPVRPYFLPPYTAPENITDETPRYLILLDEFMAADTAIRKSAFELLTEHRCGPHVMGENVYICAAGNTAEDGTNVIPLDRAEKRRMTFFGVITNAEAVVEYGQRMNWHPYIIAFIKNNPDYLVPSEQDDKNDNLATPNPASYELCSNTMKAWDAGYIEESDVEHSIMGNIGHAAGNELLLQIRDQEARYDLHALIDAEPEDRVYPKNVFGVHSLGIALAGWATDGEKLDKAVEIMIGMPNGSTAHPYEAKTAFIMQIGDKITKFRKLPQYIEDENVIELLNATGQMTDLKDAEHREEEREAQEELARSNARQSRQAA